MKFFSNVKQFFLLLVFISLLFISCKKNPGIGGDASIRGNIHVMHFNTTFTEFISEYPGADIYVYLIFGDDISYGKRIKTTFDGAFEFKYLYKGDYTVYVYSLDSTLASGNGSVPIVENVHIGDRKEIVDLDTIRIFQ